MTFPERWFEEVWNKGRESAIDEMMSPDAKGNGLVDAEGKPVTGIETFKAFHRAFTSAFSNIRITVEDVLTEGDKIAARCVFTGTHTGEGIGKPASGRDVTMTGMTWIRLKDGKIVESWNNFDFAALHKQVS
jgi:steroid delta-isomerase-like uncharacterized protein